VKLDTNRRSGGLCLLFAILSAWFFLAGFEQPWTISHITMLVVLVTTLPLSVYFYGRHLFRG
jgi:hypothetical protein